MYVHFTNEARRIRGEIIERAIYLEREIDKFIAAHFCKTQEVKTEFIELIISTDRMTFEGKRQIFQFLVEKYHKDFLKKNQTIFKDISKVLEYRNKFAHYDLYGSFDAIQYFHERGSIFLVKFKNDTKHIEFTKAYMEEMDILTSGTT